MTNSNQSSTDYLGLLTTASLTVIGMSLVFISVYNFGLPVSAIAFGIALISFSLAAYRRWLSKPASANLRGNHIQIFSIFGITSLLLGLLAPLIPLPDPIELPVIAQVLFGLLMFGVVLWMIKNH
jgi:hypothetical protein